MRWLYISLLLSASKTFALLNWRQLPLIRHTLESESERQRQQHQHQAGTNLRIRRGVSDVFLTNKTKPYRVNGTGIPEIDFDLGESYAGLLPIGDKDDTNQLYFWFFPSGNPAAKKEIVIWLTGGPGCSSTGELTRGNGPFVWPPGTTKPSPNRWGWHALSNVVWVDQPVGSGFSRGQVTAHNELDVAKQFLGFWKNFVDRFALKGYKVYITGSSYSGMYSPYIASAMLDAEDKDYFNVAGMQVFDGVFSNLHLASNIPMAAFAETWSSVLSFNDSVKQAIRAKAKQCGYTDYMNKHIAFPPNGSQPAIPPGLQPHGTLTPGCDIMTYVGFAARDVNPCFSVYDVTKHCPLVFDPLGFNDGLPCALPGSSPVYFNRPDVKVAINAPADADWAFCTSDPVFVNGIDQSLAAGSSSVLASVVDRTHNVIIGHGMRDLALPANGTLLAIQNTTWGGKQGFRSRPADPLYVPYHDNSDPAALAGAGVLGTSHSERGLTYAAVAGAGHFLGLDAPAVAYRGLEVLLGRVKDLQSTAPFSTDEAATPQPRGPLGRGTVLVGLSAEPSGQHLAPVAAVQGTKSVRSGSHRDGYVHVWVWVVTMIINTLAVLFL